MERGEVEPSWQMVIAFATALGVSYEVFSGCEHVAREEPVAKSAGKKKDGKK
jgi:hypothetical protein